MTDKLRRNRYSRRELASLAGMFAPAALAAQQPAHTEADLLGQRKGALADAAAELKQTPVSITEEPMFALVLK